MAASHCSLAVHTILVIAVVAAIGLASPASPAPCYDSLNPSYESICSTLVQTDGDYAVRIFGVGVQASIATAYTVQTNYSTAITASAANIFNYFLGDNLNVRHIPLTVPLIFRPTPAGTWSSSMFLAASVVPSLKDAPEPFPPTNVGVEAFGQHRLASYTFRTAGLAKESDYQSACANLTSYMTTNGLQVAAGPWEQAWVTYSTLETEGDNINECWIEVAPAPEPPVYTIPPCYNPLNVNFESVCYKTLTTAEGGAINIRQLGVGVNATLAVGYSTSTNFTNATYTGTYNVLSYFSYDNTAVLLIPRTVPIIYRPTQAGTWSTSMVLATSLIRTPAAAPGPGPFLNMEIEPFGQHTIAAYTFYTIYLATPEDYETACAHLTAYLAGQGLKPVPGDWAQAWVTYSAQSRLGNRINECWIEVDQ